MKDHNGELIKRWVVLTFKYDEDRENRVGLLSMKMELF